MNIEKIIKDGNKIWELKDMKRIYINNLSQYLEFVGEPYGMDFYVNGMDFSNLCLNARKKVFYHYKINDTIKIFYDFATNTFSYKCDECYNKIAENIIEKLNTKYNNDNEVDESTNSNEKKIDTFTTTEAFEEGTIIEHRNKKIKILSGKQIILSKEDVEIMYGGCFIDYEEEYELHKDAYEYTYIEL